MQFLPKQLMIQEKNTPCFHPICRLQHKYILLFKIFSLKALFENSSCASSSDLKKIVQIGRQLSVKALTLSYKVMSRHRLFSSRYNPTC